MFFGSCITCITAIHKSSTKSSVGNYRPVSITSIFCKMMESIVRDNIVEYMTTNNLFADEQHGFVPKRDCMTNLLLCIEDWTKAIESGYDVDVIYTDFAKAFDSVPHNRLLVKLETLGIKGHLLNWIKAFLTGRKHRVCVDGELSGWVYAKSGIPQGSVLGPTLFVIFINDLPQVIMNSCKLFADDAKLYKTIQSEDDTTSLQDDINAVVKWSEFWQLPFNESKCKCIHIGKGKSKHQYHMKEHQLENVKKEKDLGILMDEKLKFHANTSAAVKKANRILGLIKKSFASLDETTLPLLYTTMVRPHLEYGNIIWGPHFEEDKKLVEKVQKRATKLIPTLKQHPYRSRLEKLNLPSLAHRRERADMTMCYKIITNKIRLNYGDFFTMNSNITRGHKFKLKKNQRATKLTRCQSFSIRTVNSWNSLSSNVVEAKSIFSFKQKLDKSWTQQKFDSPFT